MDAAGRNPTFNVSSTYVRTLSRIAAHIQARKDGVCILRCSIVSGHTTWNSWGQERRRRIAAGMQAVINEVFVVDEIYGV